MIEAPLTFDIHDSIVLTGQVYQPGSPPGLGVAQNITNWSLTFDIHPIDNPNNILKSYFTTTSGGVTTSSGITIPIGTDGRYIVTIPNSDVVALGNKTTAPLGLGGRVRLLGYVAYRTDVGSEAGLSRGPLSITLS
jgi:hypothetical protein